MKKKVELIKKQAPILACLFYLFFIPLSYAYDREAEVKAAYLYRLSLFVEWPEDKKDSSKDLTICIAEDSEFYHSVVKSISEKKINDKTLNIHQVYLDNDMGRCHVLFIPEQTENIDWYMNYASKKPILTIGESTGFLENNGIIFLYKKNDRMKFFINPIAAAKSKLKVRAQLLKLSTEPDKDEQ